MRGYQKVRFATNSQLAADQYKCVVEGCVCAHRFDSRAELRDHMETHMNCEYCQKTFTHRRFFREHLKQDTECKKIKKAIKRMVQGKASKLAKSFREEEYDSSSSDSGISSNYSEPEPAIKMTFGKPNGKYEVVMASENVINAKSYNTPVNKKRKLDCDNIIKNPMVTIKSEIISDLDLFNVKQEEDAEIEDLIGDSDAEDIKPFVPTPVSTKNGIRLTIDKRNLTVAMISETPGYSLNEIDARVDIKPDIKQLEQVVKPGIKMLFGREKRKEDFSVILASEPVDAKAPTINKHKCENSDTGCLRTRPHICVFPKFLHMPGLVKTKGALNLNHSCRGKNSKFVIFNKSFYRYFGCIFYFKSHNGHIEVRSRSNFKLNFKLTLYKLGFETSGVSTLGDNKYKSSLALPTVMFKDNCIKYKIVIYDVPC